MRQKQLSHAARSCSGLYWQQGVWGHLTPLLPPSCPLWLPLWRLSEALQRSLCSTEAERGPLVLSLAAVTLLFPSATPSGNASGHCCCRYHHVWPCMALGTKRLPSSAHQAGRIQSPPCSALAKEWLVLSPAAALRRQETLLSALHAAEVMSTKPEEDSL